MSRKNGTPRMAAPKRPAELRVRDWYMAPDCEQVARRSQVWGLFGWYHRTVVEPQLGFAGGFRRLWWRLTGQRGRLLSPWDQLELRLAALAEQHARELEAATHPAEPGGQ